MNIIALSFHRNEPLQIRCRKNEVEIYDMLRNGWLVMFDEDTQSTWIFDAKDVSAINIKEESK